MEGNTGFTIERELQVKKVKRVLDNWREITLILNSVLLWRKNYYPWVVVATTSFFFLEFAYYSPSFLTSLGLFGLIATLLDFGVPYVSSMIWRQEDWNTEKEREFEDVCRALASCIVYVKQYVACVMEIKTTKPIMYCSGIITTSLSLALIGNAVNNVFIMYLICISILMLPGALHYGIVQKYYQIILVQVMNIVRTFTSSISKTKTQ